MGFGGSEVARHTYNLRPRRPHCPLAESSNNAAAPARRVRSRSRSVKQEQHVPPLPTPIENKALPRSCLRLNPCETPRLRVSSARKLVRFRRMQRRRSKRQSARVRREKEKEHKRSRSGSVASRQSSSRSGSLSDRQIGIRKRKAFLARIRSQEPDIDKQCVIRRTESDDVLIRQKRHILAKKTLKRNQKAISHITRIESSAPIGKGGFGEVSGWVVTQKDSTRTRVAVKSFDPVDGGQKLARAEASVMAEFESLLGIRMLLWFVPHKPTSFPADFPAPSIIMPLFETRNCASPSLHNLVFEKKLIQPTVGWILRTLIHILVAVSKLHAAGWAHGDLHGGNIILHNRKVILIDYSKANRKNRPYVYSLDPGPSPGIDWVKRLDWIEPLAVIGQDCCSRAADIWSLGKLTDALLELSLSYSRVLRAKEERHLTRLHAFIHLAFHKRKSRPDAKFLIEVLRSRSFSSLNLCSCQKTCEMLQKA
ncbi:hypothetical protein BV898_10607 [Hypsibius exemplaris]|uniref:Protein kinase domain-containing protein n=1 Tax=Hypsibius exemplaris TaxID=2072580 RepID=A0A1W0WJ38_HYPEX|nr:hypothetical protein BV898_10607 [Hypsibius exemplaris]